MRNNFILFAVTIFFISCNFRNPEQKQFDGRVGTAYGKSFDYSVSISASDLVSKIGNAGLDTILHGKIQSICSDKRCVTLEATDSSNIELNWIGDFKITDDAVGKTAVAKGHAYPDTSKAGQYSFKATGLVVY